MQLWEHTPGLCEEIPAIRIFEPAENAPKTDACVICFPGGGYGGRADHEGIGYAEFFAANGYHAFAVDYRVAPHRHPLPVLDARRAVRWVRAHAAEYGIDKNKIAVIGSSAGGHLCASLCTYTAPIEFEGVDAIDDEDYLPNAQILCYPVICAPDDPASHWGSYQNLLGTGDVEPAIALDPARNVGPNTPPAFIWHTSDDDGVNVINSYRYGIALREQGILHEVHVFPHGPHGMGLAAADPHVAQWNTLVLNWLKQIF